MKQAMYLFLPAMVISFLIHVACLSVVTDMKTRLAPRSPRGTASWYEEGQEMSEKIRSYRIVQLTAPLFVFIVCGFIAAALAGRAGRSVGMRLLIIASSVVLPLLLFIIMLVAEATFT